jgi:endonuclease III
MPANAPKKATKAPLKKKTSKPPAKAARTPASRTRAAGERPVTERPAKPTRADATARRSASKTTKVATGRARSDWEEIDRRLARAVPNAICELRFESPFALLIATILAAQSTDRTVNAVLPSLLARFPTPHALAESSQEEVEELVKRTGFFRNKAKAIRGTAAMLVAEHTGEVPRTLDALVALPGVARKTANVVLGTAYRIASGFVVDTHVTRVSQRLALTSEKDPVRIEQDLCRGFPESHWIDLSHRFVLHGRYTCVARTPQCSECALNELCPSRVHRARDDWEARALREAKRIDDAIS